MHGTAQHTFKFDNTFARDLKGLYVDWRPSGASKPELVMFNRALAHELGIEADEWEASLAATAFSGNAILAGSHPLAQAYAGHQFGGFSPQLGDGRALLLGEVVDIHGLRRDIQLKGAGRTPFSRSGDGKAALGPVLREYLIAEAMHALGIPTTRALAAVKTGDVVQRETDLPGAVLTRVAASHIRVGTFQFFAARKDIEKLKRLADYVISRHYPDLNGSEDPYVDLLSAVQERQASLIAKWMLVGFVHGVMNTDNMAISGETIDYGPCAFIDTYDPAAVFSFIDRNGRYAYSNQPIMGQWNLARFAETLIPLISTDTQDATRRLSNVLGTFVERYVHYWLSGMRQKLGLEKAVEGDLELANELLEVMAEQKLDFTSTFRFLSKAVAGDYCSVTAAADDPTRLGDWLRKWQARSEMEGLDARQRQQQMDKVNPIYIPRNYKVEEALDAAVSSDDFQPFKRLQAVLTRPFDIQVGAGEFTEPPPHGCGPHTTYCGT